MPYTVPEHHVLQFSSNVELLSQQKQSKLEGLIMNQSFYGEGAEAVKQYGDTEFSDLTDPTGDTVFDTIGKDSRWVYPSDKKNVLPTTREDEIRTIINTTSPLVMAQAAGLGRLKDAFALRALGATAKTGKYDAQIDTDLPASNILDATATGFLSTVKDALQLLEDEDASDEMGTIVVLPAAAARELQDDPEFTSSDFNTSQALAGGASMYKGKLQGFLNCTWVTFSEKFLTETMGAIFPTDGPGGTPLDLSTTAYVFRGNGICLGLWTRDGKMVESHVDQRKDKNYTWQVYSKLTLGSTRLEEARVVQIDNAGVVPTP